MRGAKRTWTLLLAGLLAGCAPAAFRQSAAPAVPRTATPAQPTQARPTLSAGLQASFSEGGVIWLEGGRVTLARAPGFRLQAVALPGPASAVAWQGGLPWVALGGLGLLVSADGRPLSVPVGRVVALSATRAYRQDGSAVSVSPAGAVTPAGGVPGTPSAVLTGGDGLDYAEANGALYRVTGLGEAQLLDESPGPLLSLTPQGAVSARLPGVQTLGGLYRLTGTALERLDGSGRLLASAPHPPGQVGVVSGMIVTVSAGGRLRVFAPDLRELRP